ncbi:hypothetical protein OAM67_01250 [bacterium]|nr:hypothetical protein [bacterium]
MSLSGYNTHYRRFQANYGDGSGTLNTAQKREFETQRRADCVRRRWNMQKQTLCNTEDLSKAAETHLYDLQTLQGCANAISQGAGQRFQQDVAKLSVDLKRELK